MRAITRLVCPFLCAWLLAIGFVGAVRAQESEENPRAGRLGGSADQFERIFGEADDAADDQLTYEPLDVLGADVQLGIHKEKIFEIVVTASDGDDLGRQATLEAVALLAPADGACDEDPIENELAEEVYQCHSESLEKAYAEATLNDLGFAGAPGDYHHWADGDIVTIAVGHDVYTEPEPTAVPPTPTPTLEEELASYVPLADVRELAIRPAGLFGQKIFFYGTILTIQVATPGNVFVLGDDDPIPAEAAIQVTVAAPDGSTETIFVAYDGDTAGMFEGSYVVVYGEVVGTQSGTNAFGGTITQPLVQAIFVSL